MSLEHLCAEIESRSQAQASAAVKAAHEEAKRILDTAHAAGARTLEAARAEAEAFSSAEASSRLTACQLEASRHLVESREEAVQQSLEQVWEYFSQAPKRAGYAAKLKAWAQKALDELDTPGAVLRANESDTETLHSAGFKVSKKPIECAGGVRAETADGRISVDYTLESQFERKREELLHLIHQKLFSDSDSTMLEIPKEGNGDGKGAARSRSGSRKELGRRPRLGSARASRPARILDFSSTSLPVSSRSRLGRRKSRS
ncbi:V-type ATP synthase subunit E [uncultured archaeon]|nr:V-type ATP synthase subunit E [uncultured archaeon]